MPEQEDCPLCHGTGAILRQDEDGVLWSSPCPCMEVRASRRRIEASGLGDLFESCTFKSFKVTDDWTKRALELCVDYCRNGRGKWLYLSGKPGTGKTHLCTAVCRYLLKKGAGVRYFLWREDAPKLKALVNDEAEYSRRFNELVKAHVLYVDDFLKGTVTDADLNLAFALINARYNQKNTRTIFSSERSIRDVRGYDEAIGGRIRQRAEGYTLLAPPSAKDYRAAGKDNE